MRGEMTTDVVHHIPMQQVVEVNATLKIPMAILAVVYSIIGVVTLPSTVTVHPA